MKIQSIPIVCFLFFYLTINGQSSISDLEYFFNSDPGVGNATRIDVANASTLNVDVTIPISNLNSGIHVLHIRSQNDANTWGFYGRQSFYIANFSNNLDSSLSAAEYFVDTDPGVGKGKPLNIIPGATVNSSFAIPLDSVSTGIHILNIRVKNELNQWSMYGQQVFYKSSKILNNTITAAEYFIDTDPGAGNAIVLPIPKGPSANEFFSLPLSSLSEGTHILHIRVKNASDQWSLYARQLFYKSPKILNNELIAAEYFIDEDPGIGKATPVTITQSASIDELLNINIPEDLAEGSHILHLRVQRTDGTWSIYGRPEFTSTLSIGDFALENFKLYPNPVADILNLSISNATLEQVKVIDLNGKVVLELFDNLEKLQLQTLSSGIYLVQIRTSLGSVSKKIIKN